MTTTPAAPALSSSTPILDRAIPVPEAVQPSPKRGKTGVVVLLAVIVITAAWIVLMVKVHAVSEFFFEPAQRIQKYLDKALENTFSGHLNESLSLWRFWTMWFAIVPVVVLHELGHAIACLLVGFRVVGVRLGPLLVIRPFRVQWVSRKDWRGARGITSFVPVSAHKLRSRALWVFSAGPLSNFLSAFVVALVTTPRLFSVAFVVTSVFVGVANLVSFRLKGLRSDGQHILRLIRKPREGERRLALTRLNADIASGIDPEKLNPQFLAIATAVEDESPETVNAHVLAFSTAFEKHDDPEAARLLEVGLRHSGCTGPVLREAAFLNAAIFQAERRKHPDLAEQWMADLPEKPLFPQSRINAQGAILQARGDIAGALKKLDESEAMVLQRAPSPGKEASLRALQKWRAELLEQTDSRGKQQSPVNS